MQNQAFELSDAVYIRHVKGTENVPTDTMSTGINVFPLDPYTEYQSILEEQSQDQMLQKFPQNNTTSLKFLKIQVLNSDNESVGYQHWTITPLYSGCILMGNFLHTA